MYFAEGAVCSSRNDDCCNRECQFASSDIVCRNASQSFCTQQVYCTGSSARCPDRDVRMPAGAPCALNGKCNEKGECEPYCMAQHQRPTCACTAPEHRCRRCCIEESGTCRPYNLPNERDVALYLPKGLPCVNGFCEVNGTCTVVKHALVQRVWSFLGKMTFNAFWIFVKNNIVGCTVIATLLLWIPVALAIYCCYDLPQYKQLNNQYKEFIEHEEAAAAAARQSQFSAQPPSFYPKLS